MKCSSDDLLDRLRKRGTRDPGFTRNLIIEKLTDTDFEVATTTLKVSVLCPLGKMRMVIIFNFRGAAIAQWIHLCQAHHVHFHV